MFRWVNNWRQSDLFGIKVCGVYKEQTSFPRVLLLFSNLLWVLGILTAGMWCGQLPFLPLTTLVSRCPGRRKGVLLAQKLSFPLALGCQGPRGSIQGAVVGL